MTIVQWFYRDGTEHRGTVAKADMANGTARALRSGPCPICGAAGLVRKERWSLTCYRCRGRGVLKPHWVTVYTTEGFKKRKWRRPTKNP